MKWIERRHHRHWHRKDASVPVPSEKSPIDEKKDITVTPQVTSVMSFIDIKIPEIYGVVVDACNHANQKNFSNNTILCSSLVFAIIYCESMGNPWACRYEPAFFSWLVKRLAEASIRPSKLVSRYTEETMRSTSFGLMQIMGQTARELGFTGTFLTQLCDTNINVCYGVEYLVSRMKKFKKKEEYIAAYNSGTPKYDKKGVLINKSYVDKVIFVQGIIKEELKLL